MLTIKDQVGNSITIIGGWYKHFKQHPDKAKECLEIIQNEAEKLSKKIMKIKRENKL